MLITIRQTEGRDAMKRLAAALPRIVARAATETAFAIRKEEQAHFRQALDRPRPAVISAIRVQRAQVTTGGTSTSAVYVGHSDRGFQRRLDVALGLQEEGGRLTPGMLDRKRIAVPVAVQRDAFGGMSRSTIPRLLRRKDVFVGRIGPKGGRPGSFGIYQREILATRTATGKPARDAKGRFLKQWQRVRTGKVRLLVALEKATEYRRPRLRFYEVARNTARRVFPMELSRALGRAAAR